MPQAQSPEPRIRNAESTAASQKAPLKVALLGFGTVGASVARILVERPELADRLQLTHVFNRDVSASVPTGCPRQSSGPTDFDEILAAGPTSSSRSSAASTPAHEWVSQAIEQGASVVTANKMLLAAHGPELLESGIA